MLGQKMVDKLWNNTTFPILTTRGKIMNLKISVGARNNLIALNNLKLVAKFHNKKKTCAGNDNFTINRQKM